MKKIQTLCLIHQHPKILLGMKKRGFGQGRWNGFGGKVAPEETVLEAAKREMLEEAGLEIVLAECWNSRENQQKARKCCQSGLM